MSERPTTESELVVHEESAQIDNLGGVFSHAESIEHSQEIDRLVAPILVILRRPS